ncbi:MAG: hypothetical protein DHS80DRAFT_25565 [Piptocephalis tieghemiana]|nr:MAG: hypothetical protein DHS80DRAFT_25565 [Piptocephalis tieghemiana]
MRPYSLALPVLAVIIAFVHPTYGWYPPVTVTQTTTVQVTPPPVTETSIITATITPPTVTKTKTVTKTITSSVTQTRTITVTAPPSPTSTSGTNPSPTFTFPNPPPRPPSGSSSTYLFSIQDPEINFDTFDAQFKRKISQVNTALDNPNANTIITTLKLTNFVSYTITATVDVYDWILHDARIKTFDADGSGSV